MDLGCDDLVGVAIDIPGCKYCWILGLGFGCLKLNTLTT